MFPWLMTAFAAQLDCRELLLLWDRVIGFDSLDIIAGQLHVPVFISAHKSYMRVMLLYIHVELHPRQLIFPGGLGAKFILSCTVEPLIKDTLNKGHFLMHLPTCM